MAEHELNQVGADVVALVDNLQQRVTVAKRLVIDISPAVGRWAYQHFHEWRWGRQAPTIVGWRHTTTRPETPLKGATCLLRHLRR